MRNKRILGFALAGLLIALALQLAGYRMDHAVPRLALGDQVLYNWLSLLFSPVAFFLRLGNPDAPIVAGWISFLIAIVSNSLLYAGFYRICESFFFRLQVKLAHDNLLAVAERHPERIIHLAAPNWRARRI